MEARHEPNRVDARVAARHTTRMRETRDVVPGLRRRTRRTIIRAVTVRAQAADFQRRARRLRAAGAGVAGRETVQPGCIGEPHRWLHAGGGVEILVAGHQMCLLCRVPEIHLPSALSTGEI